MTSKSHIEKAQEIVGRSLFLFGAGATKDAGCLVSSEMLDDIQKMELSDPERDALDFLLSALHYHSSWKNIKEKKKPNESNGHQPNIEDLMLLIRRIINRDSYLPYPITGSWADKINFLEIAWKDLNRTWSPERSKTLFENLQEKLSLRLSSWLNLGREETDYLLPISEYLKQTNEKSPALEFFTLNYDLVFEKHFNSQDETLLNNGFTSGYFEGFSDDDTPNRTQRINYYKLHGSINWEKEETGKIKESFYYTDGKFSVRVEEDHIEDKEVGEFLSLPPSDAHIIFGQGGKFLTVDPFISLLYSFKKHLGEKDIFFVIGYSFFDPYINNMLLEGLSSESIRPKMMVVVNPQFSKEMLTKEEQERGDWEELLTNRFIDHIQNIQKSTYLSELPDFNLLEVSPQKIKIIPKFTAEFFKNYFSSDENGLASLYDELEQKDDDIF